MCARFRPDDNDILTCGYCSHDISAHQMLAVLQDGKPIALGTSAPASIPLPLPLRETAEQERKRIFNGGRGRSSASLKRKVTSDDDEFKRVSNRRASAPRPKNIVAKLIAMKRIDQVPNTDFDHTELGADYFENTTLTTSASLTSLLKMTSTMGEFFSKRFYLYIRNTNRTLKPTQYWSQNWPSERALASLCLEKHLYVIPKCYEDEEKHFLTATQILENDTVEILNPMSPSTSSSIA